MCKSSGGHYIMGKVFYNQKPIPIPDGCYIDKSDGRVLAKIADNNGKFKRRTIGVVATEGTMYPNELFQQLFRALWEQYYPAKTVKEYELSVGMYGLTLGISHQIKLYDLLHDIYGESNVNYILDYVMYSCLYRDDTTQLYPERMRKELLFSEKVYSDEWYSVFFKEKINENQNHEFRLKWLQYCHDRGVTKAWMCIDGSNNDCEVKRSPLCEQGEAKSRSHSDIVGYMYVISATDGRPITYYVYEGSKPDQSAFHQVAMILQEAKIELAGVILDAGFCTADVIDTLEKCSLEYVIMMHDNHLGQTSSVKEFGEKIKWKPQYLVSDDGVFGTSSRKKLFRFHERESYVNIFFDAVRGTHESIDLSKRIRDEKRRLEKLINSGKTAAVTEPYSKYIDIGTDQTGNQKVIYKYDNWREDTDEKGFFAIVSSSDFGAEQVYETYRLRDASETAYSLLKSQQGFHTTRVHSTPSILNKFAVGFITSIIRTEIEITCQLNQLDTNLVIQRLDHVHVFLAPGYTYMFSNSIRRDLQKVLSAYSMTKERFDALASEINFRLDSQYRNRYRAMPQVPNSKQSKKTEKPKPVIDESNDSSCSHTEQNEVENSGVDTSTQTNDTNAKSKQKKRPGRKIGSKDSYKRTRRTKAEIERDRKKELL